MHSLIFTDFKELSSAPLRQDFLALLRQNRVALSPTVAVRRIENFFGARIAPDGSNIEGIEIIRREIHRLDRSGRLAQALLITAPHTHWGEKFPILERFDGRYFYIGPLALRGKLAPKSFVFSKNGPLPFEWVDEKVGLLDTDLLKIWDYIERLNAIIWPIWQDACPLGISIHHRFKDLWRPSQISTSESPYTIDGQDQGIGVIKPWSAELSDPALHEQVAWSAICDLSKDFSDEEGHSFRELLHLTDPLTDEQCERLILKLEASLHAPQMQ